MKKLEKKKIWIGSLLVLVLLVCVSFWMLHGNGEEASHFTSNKKETEESKEVSLTKKVYLNEEETISIDLPNDWDYALLEEKKENHLFDMRFFPEKNNKEKYLEIYQSKEELGVCGTFLTTKEIELKNQKKAIVGYYDGEEVAWSFILIDREQKLFSYPIGLDTSDYDVAMKVIQTIEFPS